MPTTITYVVSGEATSPTDFYPNIAQPSAGKHQLSFPAVSVFLTTDNLNTLTETLVKYAFDNNTMPRLMADRIAFYSAAMADDRGYEEAAADSAYDQYVDDAAMGV